MRIFDLIFPTVAERPTEATATAWKNNRKGATLQRTAGLGTSSNL
jgi:hypothetical protein